MVWKCKKCNREWYYLVEKCVYCSSKVEKIGASNYIVKGVTKVFVPSLEHPQVPYYVLLLEDEHKNFHIRKTFKKHKIGDKIDIAKKKDKELKVGVIGTGTMSTGIARLALQTGLKVILKSRTRSTLNNAIKKIEREMSKTMSPEEKEAALKNITLTTNYNDLANTDVVIESVVEDVGIKKQVFKDLDKACSKKTIFATNTSSLSVSQIGEATLRPDRIIGMHFFNPIDKMNLVEVVTGNHTSKSTINFIKELGERFNKTPVFVKDTPGFVVNRLLFLIINEAIYMLDKGIASAKDIDDCMRLGANHPIGPLTLADLIGLDLCLKILEELHNAFKHDKYNPCPLLRKMVKKGYLGKKSGRGFYQYS